MLRGPCACRAAARKAVTKRVTVCGGVEGRRLESVPDQVLPGDSKWARRLDCLQSIGMRGQAMAGGLPQQTE